MAVSSLGWPTTSPIVPPTVSAKALLSAPCIYSLARFARDRPLMKGTFSATSFSPNGPDGPHQNGNGARDPDDNTRFT